MSRRRSNAGPIGFLLWALFCLIVWAAIIAGVVWLIVELLPHITGALDRVGS